MAYLCGWRVCAARERGRERRGFRGEFRRVKVLLRGVAEYLGREVAGSVTVGRGRTALGGRSMRVTE